jgi:cullin 1
LTWLWQLCKGEIKANYIKNAKVPYTFQVSTYQMGILLLFNEADTLTYEEIEKATTLATEILDPNLSILLKAKVLVASPEGAKPEPSTSFTLNYNFKNKKVKVNLNIQIKSEQKVEADDTHKTIEEDRKLLLQSAIVRIMKSRKKMKHVQLVQEVIQQVKSRFPPKIPDIKKNIEALMEKDYIERMDGDEISYIA